MNRTSSCFQTIYSTALKKEKKKKVLNTTKLNIKFICLIKELTKLKEIAHFNTRSTKLINFEK